MYIQVAASRLFASPAFLVYHLLEGKQNLKPGLGPKEKKPELYFYSKQQGEYQHHQETRALHSALAYIEMALGHSDHHAVCAQRQNKQLVQS